MTGFEKKLKENIEAANLDFKIAMRIYKFMFVVIRKAIYKNYRKYSANTVKLELSIFKLGSFVSKKRQNRTERELANIYKSKMGIKTKNYE